MRRCRHAGQRDFQFDKVTIAPNMRVELIEESGAFQSIHLKTATIYLAEARLEAVSWDLRIAVRRGSVSYLELRMIEKDAAHDRLAEQYAAHNRFLRERLGNADKKSLGRTEYLFEWGSICSYMDIKTGECVIRVEY